MPSLAEPNLCVGCSACASICPKRCIEMEKDQYGFKYPVFMHPANCVECGMCESVCPVLNESIKENDDQPFAYAAFTKDEHIRQDSSSGGIFTEIAKRVIEENGVVYGAAYDERFVVCHCCVDKIDDLQKLRGAKYAESNLGSSFVEILDRLKHGQLVLFSGTPCQVAGLKSFVRKDFNNLICIDIVCHGVPSPMAWDAYIKYRAEKDADGKLPQSINLRSKETGWSKYKYSNVFEYVDGKKSSTVSSQSLFMKLFVGDYISRPSCSECKFKGYSRVSDITLGDFWGIWDIEPEMDDNKGTSVILVHTPNGEKLWMDIEPKINSKEVTLEQASQQNQSMLKPSKANTNSKLALCKIKDGKIDTCEEFFNIQKPTFFARIKGKVKRMIGRK